MEVYLDNSATTRVLPEVVEAMNKIYLEDYGNPSSKHMKGYEAEKYVHEARQIIAKTLRVDPGEIVFTSGGTESDNTALQGVALANSRKGKHIITTKIEHPAILRMAEYLEKQGYEITYLPVSKEGVINPEELAGALRDDTILVSIMHTNNEIGSIMPIEECGRIIKKRNSDIVFHVDAVQGYGKCYIYPKKMNIDLLSVSGHKIHGPKGIGFLYVKDKVKMIPFMLGGGQQGGIRSGTENVPGIMGMALAAQRAYEKLESDREKMYALKEQLITGLLTIDDVIVNGPSGREGAPHIVSASFKNAKSEVILHSLEEKGIYVSSGSACASNKNTVSDTLLSVGVAKEYLDSTIRFSMSCYNTKEEIDYTIAMLKEIIPELRKYVRH